MYSTLGITRTPEPALAKAPRCARIRRFSSSFHVAAKTFLRHVGLDKAGDGVGPSAEGGVIALRRYTTFSDVGVQILR